jgi:hypothetical protein
MRGMIKRTLVAGVAVLGMSVASAPVPAGGFVSGHGSFQGGFHGSFAHGGIQGFGVQPLVRPGQVPPLATPPAQAAVSRMSGLAFARHRRFFGFDAPVAGFGTYGPLSEPVYVGTVERPLPPPVLENAPRNGEPMNVCQTEERTVPSEAGGQRTIHITRCWN